MASEEEILKQIIAERQAQEDAPPKPYQRKGSVQGPQLAPLEEFGTIARAKVRKDGGVKKAPIEDIPFGTFTSLGAMAGPYGAAAGLVADIGSEAYRANRATQRRNRINKETAEIQAIQSKDKAARMRNDLEQNALSALMGVGSA